MLPALLSLPGIVIVDDTDPSIEYTGQWDLLPTRNGGYYGGFLHRAMDASASATLTFIGSHIYYLADFAPDHGIFTLAIDDGAPTMLSTQTDIQQFVKVIFDQDLEPGEHTIKLQNLEDRTMALDCFVYVPLPTSGPSTTATTGDGSTNPVQPSSAQAGNSTQPAPQGNARLPAVAIVGIAWSCGAAIAFCTLFVFLAIRKCRQRAARSQHVDTASAAPTGVSQRMHPSRDDAGYRHDDPPVYEASRTPGLTSRPRTIRATKLSTLQHWTSADSRVHGLVS